MRTHCEGYPPHLTDGVVPSAHHQQHRHRSRWAGVSELGLVVMLYFAYTGSRLLAARDPRPAVHRARVLLRIEAGLHLDREHAIVEFFLAHRTIAVLSCYWYSAAHYLVTPAALYWLYRQGRDAYLPTRRALLLATLLGLFAYLLFPTAPPRMLSGYADILSLHAAAGWWGTDASAPRGLGGLTNELAAFPSLHAGWSLWVALAAQRWGRRRISRVAGWAHALVTGVVVVGTANHWILDVLGGWAVVAIGWALTAPARPGRSPTAGRGIVAVHNRSTGAFADRGFLEPRCGDIEHQARGPADG